MSIFGLFFNFCRVEVLSFVKVVLVGVNIVKLLVKKDIKLLYKIKLDILKEKYIVFKLIRMWINNY